MESVVRRYGWKPDPLDFRDKYHVPRKPKAMPPVFSLRSHCPPVYEQGSLGSCTANAIGSAFQFEQMLQTRKGFMPSRLFIYYNEREMEGTINEDAGAIIRDGMKSMVKQGVCPESEWEYSIRRFAKKPPAACYQHALDHQLLVYKRVNQTLDDMKACLLEGHPFVFGFSVYESFESAAVSKHGLMPMPEITEKLNGGHAVKTVGYSDDIRCLEVKNSWGDDWGDHGYFWMPYDCAVHPDLCSDFWTMRLVEA